MTKILNKLNLKTIMIITIFISQLAIANLLVNAEDNEPRDNEYPLKLEQINPEEINATDVAPKESIEEINLNLSNCNIIAEGSFADQSGANGVAGAPWTLCDDGVLRVGAGFINSTGSTSPWNAHRALITRIIFTEDVTAGTSLNSFFRNLNRVTAIDGIGRINTRNVTNMESMFRDAASLRDLDLSSWDTGNVRNMVSMFRHTTNLRSVDVSTWDTGNVTQMVWMFDGARSLSSLDVSGWNTSRVTRMNVMFQNAISLTYLDVSGWDTRNVELMNHMFFANHNLADLDVSDWDTRRVRSMSHMFVNARSLRSLDTSGWNTGSVTNMTAMFSGATGLRNLDVSGWNTRNVTSMDRMLQNTRGLTSLDVSEWDTRNVTNMNALFLGNTGLAELDVSSWNTGRVANMTAMFSGATGLVSLDVSGWNTSNVTSMERLFQNTRSLTELDVSDWDTSRVRTMDRMFTNASSLTSLDVSGWNIGNVTNMSSLFSGTTSLRQLALGAGFSNANNLNLPPVLQDYEFTGYWRNVGSGTVGNPLGDFIFTSPLLLSQFGPPIADVWVWQPANQSMLTPREILENLIRDADGRDQANYTPATWANMMSRLTFARNVLNNPTASDAQIEEAIELLSNALQNLIVRS